MNPKLPLILYDSECTLCKRFKDGLEFIDRNSLFSFVSIHDNVQMDELLKNFTKLDKNACHETVHLIDEEHKILKGAEVIEYIAKHLPGVSKLSWLLETGRGQRTLHFFYDKINEFRSKQDCCNGHKK